MNENECGHMAGIWPAKQAFGAMRFWLFLVLRPAMHLIFFRWWRQTFCCCHSPFGRSDKIAFHTRRVDIIWGIFFVSFLRH